MTNSSATYTSSTRTTARVPASKSGASTGAGRTQTPGSPRRDKSKFVIRTTTDKYNACEYLSELETDEQHPFVVEIHSHEERRNKLQNAYLWGWLYRYTAEKLEEAGEAVALASGEAHPYTTELLHTMFVSAFLCYGTMVDPITGSEVKLCYSTTKLLKSARRDDPERWPRSFPFYVESIKEFVRSMWGIDIPPSYSEEFRSLERELHNRGEI